ncbi:hypothetical protein [Alicyclobacillus herbarius]|uniref:hypothetical protein n=1 Tax=Alicyclobacillus herbarius TaxID=122960 RepID=UPI0003FA7BA0|nr:hypothetical protein [Alicyclobacillus herbarius]
MLKHGFVSDASRKAKASRHVYEYLKRKVARQDWIESVQWENIEGVEGIPVPEKERFRVINLRLHDEHLSPYFKTDMNLFQMLMLDDSVSIQLFRARKGWLYVFEGIPAGPKPFGKDGYDTR